MMDWWDEVKGVKGCPWFLFTLMDNGVFTGKRCVYMKECLESQHGVKRGPTSKPWTSTFNGLGNEIGACKGDKDGKARDRRKAGSVWHLAKPMGKMFQEGVLCWVLLWAVNQMKAEKCSLD